MGVVGAGVNFAGAEIAPSSPLAIFYVAQNFRSGRRAPRETSAVVEPIRRCFNRGQLLLNGSEWLRAVMNFFHRSRNASAKFVRCDRAFTK